MGAAFKTPYNTEKSAIINTHPGSNNGCGNNGFINNYSVFANDYDNCGYYGNHGNFGRYGGCSYGSGLSPQERRMLRYHFDSLAGRDRRLSFQEFVILFGRVNPHLTGPRLVNMAERAFLYYDANRTGYMRYFLLKVFF